MRAGLLHEQVAFDATIEQDDGHGAFNTVFTPEVDAYECWANFLYLRGGEIAQGARMEGRQVVVVTIRANPSSRAIGINHRIRDLNTGQSGAVRSPAVLTDDRAFLELTVEMGAPE